MMVREMVEWMVCYSNSKPVLQRLLLAIHQFFETERQEISDCERCCFFLCFVEAGRDQNNANPNNTPSFIRPTTQP